MNDLNIDNITWEIEPDETRARNEKLLRVTVFTLLGILAVAFREIFFESSGGGVSIKGLFIFLFVRFLFLSLFVIIPALIFYFIIKNSSFHRRVYSLNRDGFEITIDGQKENYSWDGFESFFDHTQKSVLRDLRINEAAINGRNFYLRRKGGFFSKYVIIYSEPDSCGDVYVFIKDHLREECINTANDPIL